MDTYISKHVCMLLCTIHAVNYYSNIDYRDRARGYKYKLFRAGKEEL